MQTFVELYRMKLNVNYLFALVKIVSDKQANVVYLEVSTIKRKNSEETESLVYSYSIYVCCRTSLKL